MAAQRRSPMSPEFYLPLSRPFTARPAPPRPAPRQAPSYNDIGREANAPNSRVVRRQPLETTRKLMARFNLVEFGFAP